jgi:glutamate dehydrogenase/leucine dehydrogenase
MDYIKLFEEKAPEVIFEWTDPITGAQAWLVINSLRGGAAGGGTRMREGLTKEEVVSLAKTMEIKFTVSGPAIGGAKSGISFHPSNPERRSVLERWYRVVSPILKSYYGTGGDMNVDEIEDVIPLTEDFGLWHPQEGIVNGHYKPTEREKIRKLGQLRIGVSKIIEDGAYTPSRKEKLTVSDMITGYGVAMSVAHYYRIWKHQTVSGKRALIQGWGNVGAAAGYFLSGMGAKVVGISDIRGCIFKNDGLNHQEVTDLALQRKQKTFQHSLVSSFEMAKDQLWNTEADIFIPAAGSRLVGKHEIDQLISNGVEVVASGANVPFNEQKVFYGPLTQYADERLTVIPDFIANCGMARVFAYLMESNIDITDAAIFEDVSTTIEKALREVFDNGGQSGRISKHALDLAIAKLIV